MFEAVRLCEEIAGKKLNWTYSEANRSGDHIWWISDVSRFKAHYPDWDFKYDIRDILEQIHTKIVERLRSSSGRLNE
jgi:CDP-paratose 2-epimerase